MRNDIVEVPVLLIMLVNVEYDISRQLYMDVIIYLGNDALFSLHYREGCTGRIL